MPIPQPLQAHALTATTDLERFGVYHNNSRYDPESLGFSEITDGFKFLPDDHYSRSSSRKRALGKLDVIANSEDYSQLSFVTHATTPYFQDSKHNPELGGIGRVFSPLPFDLLGNQFLMRVTESLIRELSPLLVPQGPEIKFRFNYHMIRMYATPNSTSRSTPPGLHKDGERFITTILFNRENCKGGQNLVTNNEKTPIKIFTLSEPGASYTIDDKDVWHSVSPVRSKDRTAPGIRDVMLIDTIPMDGQTDSRIIT